MDDDIDQLKNDALRRTAALFPKVHFPELLLHLYHMTQYIADEVHFKIIIFDLKVAYIGSANLTDAGLGMKSSRTRNFEAGILTDDPALVEAAMNQFDAVWAVSSAKPAVANSSAPTL